MADKTDLRVILNQTKNDKEKDGLMKMIQMMLILRQNINLRRSFDDRKRG